MSVDQVSRMSAIQDFHRVRSQARMEELRARLTGQSTKLFSYEEVRQKLRATSTKPRGLQEIPLDAIVGSVGRYDDFTRSFLPRHDSAQSRWTGVQQATLDLVGTPPIEVYQIGDAYFVLDGNHRVSVARQLGAATIQAYVTEVKTRVPFSPDTQPDQLILKAEYADFLERTQLGKLRPQADLAVTAPGKYPILEEHIEVHRYFMGLERNDFVPLEEAAAHWYDTVYTPVVQIIREQNILHYFPDRTETDLYLWLSRHRKGLEEALGWEVELESVAADLTTYHSPRLERLAARLGAQFLDILTPDSLESGPHTGLWREQKGKSNQDCCLFTQILVPVSGQHRSWPALEQALEIARRENSRVNGLHIVASASEIESETTQAVQAEFDQRCAAAGIPGKLAVVHGEVARQICERSRWNDLIVADVAHPPASQPLAKLGNRFRTILRRCATPVLAVPPNSVPLTRTLLAYDGSPKAEEALFVATYVSKRWDIPLSVLTICNDECPETVQEHAQTYLAHREVKATFLIEQGTSIGQIILDTARSREIDLILMGGYSRSAVWEIVLGSALDQVLREFGKLIFICR